MVIQRIILATFNDCLWDQSGFALVTDEPFNHDIASIYRVSKSGMFATGANSKRGGLQWIPWQNFALVARITIERNSAIF